MAGSLDSDLASVHVAKSRLDVPQVFKHRPGFSGALVKFLGEVRVQGVQEVDILEFIQVEDELTDLPEKFLRSAFEKGNDFGLRVRSLHIHFSRMPPRRNQQPRLSVASRRVAR